MGDRASVHHLRHVRSHVGGDPFSFLCFHARGAHYRQASTVIKKQESERKVVTASQVPRDKRF